LDVGSDMNQHTFESTQSVVFRGRREEASRVQRALLSEGIACGIVETLVLGVVGPSMYLYEVAVAGLDDARARERIRALGLTAKP